MGVLCRVTTVVWEDAEGNRTAAHAAGATSRKLTSRKWYIRYTEGGTSKRVCTGVTDRAAATKVLADWLTARERKQVGLSDPFQTHYDRPISDHLTEYVGYVRSHSRSEKHVSETDRILKLIVSKTGWTTARAITVGAVTGYLSAMTQGGGTKNMHRRLLVAFCNWMEATGRLPANPIGGRKVRTYQSAKKRQRRALTADELATLLATVREYPLKAALVPRGGRKRRDGTPTKHKPVKLKPETVEALRAEGTGRWLLYRLAVFTGLRRRELSRLTVGHLRLSEGRLVLQGRYTKNGRDAVIPLVPALVADLDQWVGDRNLKATDPVVKVPDAANLTKTHQRMLAAAGLPYQDAQGRFCDFHSLRYTANVLLRRSGVERRDRMVFMRHTSAGLTENVYEDDSQIDTGLILKAFGTVG